MGTHPNAMLLLVLTPDGLSRKTHRDILAEAGIGIDEDRDISIGNHNYHHEVMEDDYNEGFQIEAKEGDIIIFNFLTYGYGEKIEWGEAELRRTALSEWATGICKRHHCSYTIYISANYW